MGACAVGLDRAALPPGVDRVLHAAGRWAAHRAALAAARERSDGQRVLDLLLVRDGIDDDLAAAWGALPAGMREAVRAWR